MEEMMKLMMHLHLNNDRQGPGSEHTTLQAIQLAAISSHQPLNNAYLEIDTAAGIHTLTPL